LRRIERDEGINLDEEFEKDGLDSLLSRFRYRAEDARAGRPNPTKIDIDPEKLARDIAFYRSAINSYRRFRAGEPETQAIEAAETIAAEEEVARTFGLERDLQSALRSNIEQLEAGLRIVDGGSEAKVEAGFIDILAQDAAGAWVVIELKADVSRPAAVAQVLAYMGCIAADRGGSVRGILVASDFDKRVEHAARAVPNLALKRYRFKFEFV
jgi:endonuclease